MFSGNVLMEFPPIVVDGSVYFMRNNGGTYRLDADTGKVKWKNQIGKLSASSPAYSDGRLFVTSLSGKITALRAPQRQAPVAEAARQPHRVLADRAARHRLLRHRGRRPLCAVRQDRPREVEVQRLGRDQGLPRAVRLDALLSATTAAACTRSGRGPDASAGRPARPARSSGSRPGTSTRRPRSTSGGSTPATPTARCTRSAPRTGTLAWSQSTGGYVYSSPAVANVPGTKPTVYIGSYDGNLYALDARTGSTRWTARGGGRISGGPSVVGRIVYFADLDSKTTYGVDARNGNARVQAQPWLLQPRGLRRQAPLHDRLRERHGARPGEEGPQGREQLS